jgi:6-pyruvoyltetrahydropterin/6-carboxytetrahydropterin synthase
MRSVTKIFKFDAAHRLLNYEGKCANLHGHTYVVEVEMATQELDHNDILVDFGAISKLVGEWLDNNWDHAVLLNSEDPLCGRLDGVSIAPLKRYLFNKSNPTAEIMAEELFSFFSEYHEGSIIDLVSVKVWETPTSFTTITRE